MMILWLLSVKILDFFQIFDYAVLKLAWNSIAQFIENIVLQWVKIV